MQAIATRRLIFFHELTDSEHTAPFCGCLQAYPVSLLSEQLPVRLSACVSDGHLHLAIGRMPCTCEHSGTTTRAFQASRRHVPDRDTHRKMPTLSPRKCCHQLPGPACQQSTVRTGYRSASGKHTENLTLCRAQKQDEKEKDMVGGFDVDSEPGFLESEAVGIIFKV